jgi:hypothetical protein
MIAESIYHTGHENVLNGINYSQYINSGTSPYHYFELYQTILQSKIVGINSLWSLICSVPIFMSVQASLLIHAILNATKPRLGISFSYFLGFALLFISGLNVLPIEYTEKNNFTVDMINHVSPKYLMIYMTLLLLIYLIHIKEYKLTLVIASALPIFSYFSLPVILVSGFLGVIVLRLTKSITTREFFYFSLLLISVPVSIFTFYHYTS